MIKQLGRNNQRFMLGNFLFALGVGLWLNLRPLYLADLGASPGQIGLALAVGGISAGIIPLPAGILSDRIGPRRVIILSWLVAVAGALVMALSQTWQYVAVGIFLFSLTWSANPAVTSFVMLSMPETLRGAHLEQAFSWVFRVWPTAMIFAPGLGGWIAEKFGIRTDIWISILAFTLATIIIWPATEVKAKNGSEKIMFGSLFHNKKFWGLAVFFGLLMIAQQIGYALLPNYLEEVRGFSQAAIGVLFSVSFIGAFVFNMIMARVSPRTAFFILFLTPWIAMILLWIWKGPFWTGLAFFLFGGITSMWIIKAASTGRVVNEEIQGKAFGMVESIGYLALAAASWIAGTLYGLDPTHITPLLTSIITIPFVFMIWLFYVVRVTGEPIK